ncbi:ArsC family reductase [Aureimonas sp. AU40]|uniref:ArsC family reductase n=1 Tax=Aureimonas sp. AU40 TaxID=1637747 RepID=UPI000783E265|nr:ArsC family reductase [Aureimonas sp. AU40]
MTVTLHGIRNCDTVKKARLWLEGQGVEHAFHDFKTQGVSHEQLARWSEAVGWEKLLNRAGTTFRKVPEAERADLSREKALALMKAEPSMIKRPVLQRGDEVLVGFKPEDYARFFG